MTRYPLVMLAMGGLGDGVYQRPFVRQLQDDRELYLATPWPELYTDLPNVRFIKPEGMGLRTQNKNIDRQPEDRWSRRPIQAERLRPIYSMRQRGRTILEELETHFPKSRRPFVFDLPDFGPCPLDSKSKEPYAVIRPATVRREWVAGARNPDPKYLAQASKALSKAGYRVISVADVDEKNEWFDGDPPPADAELHAGELPVNELLALVQHADVVVGGVGWIVPVTCAMGVPAVIVGGGYGGVNAPDLVVDHGRMDGSRIRFILPDDYCECLDARHDCAKGIRGFSKRFAKALDAVTAKAEAA